MHGVKSMEYIIKNDRLKVTVDSFGAALVSIDTIGGDAFMYDGNPKYWSGRDLNLFPYIGRLYNEKYLYKGAEYQLGIHGFAWQSDFNVDKAAEDCVSFCLSYNEETLKCYPFKFNFWVSYKLTGNRVAINYRVENLDDKEMIFGVGGHPAFRVPLDDRYRFEDYYLEFSQETIPTRIGMSDDCYVTGRDSNFQLQNNKQISLRHELFDDDAVILKNMPRSISLKSNRSKKAIRVEYPKMSCLGIWHMPKTDAPYICIEPWTSLSGREGLIEDIECQSDLIHLDAKNSYENEWYIIAEEGEKI